MYIGAQVSLYPMTSDFVDVIVSGLDALTPYRDDLRIETDVMGDGDHMAEIWGCIDFLKSSGTFHKAKNFCTRLRGDAGPVFETLRQAFLRFGPPEGHVTIDLTASANSPSLG